MLFSYNWLQLYFKKKLPNPQKLAELLTMHSFEVEEVKKSGKDWIFNIDVLPNRAHDCLSYIGMVREIAAILRKKLNINYDSIDRKKLLPEKGNLNSINLKIQCPQLVSRYSAVVIEGVKVGSSPNWLKKYLKSQGIKLINNIVDLTNYIMFAIGQPLHAFDYNKVLEQKMILRQSKKGEKIITLDGIEHKLDNGMLVIEDKKRLIDLVGIMGGKLSEIDSKTKNIILQAGNFDQRTIYSTSKKLAFSTDASNIYIQGIDPNLTTIALESAYLLFKKLSKGKIVQKIDIYPKEVLAKKIKLDLNYLKKVLGIEISKKEVINILKKLEFQIVEVQPQSLVVKIPTFRLDILIQEDLIEEVGRIYGYDKIKPIFPVAALIPPKRNQEIFWLDIIKDILKEAGFSEVYNYSFISNKDKEIFNFSNELIDLENPISLLFQYLRPSLISNLLKNVKKNSKEFDLIKVFEIGKIFKKSSKLKSQNSKLEEKRMLSGLIYKKEPKTEVFYELKGVIDLMLEKLGISNVWYDQYKPTPEDSRISLWNPEKSAEIKINHTEIGFLGEISFEILEKLGLGKIVAFDIDFEKLIKYVSEEHEYQPISRFPAAIRDLAVLVPGDVKVVDILNKVNEVGGPLVRDIDLFDMYQGPSIPEGKKNLAFHIIYQSEKKTLKSEEVDKIHQKIIKNLEKDPEWEVRR